MAARDIGRYNSPKSKRRSIVFTILDLAMFAIFNARHRSRRIVFGILFVLGMSNAEAGVVFNNTGLTGGSRWDAAPRTISGRERSLDGGLRYSVQGGSFTAYKSLFTWSGAAPSDAAFATAIQNAFDTWRTVDPMIGAAPGLTFVADLGTTVAGLAGGGINTAGAEIDLFVANDASSWNPGDTGQRAEAWFNSVGGTVTLTSGVSGYNASAISGADITFNSGATYTLSSFQTILTHEIGHALGLGDVDVHGPNGLFIDDNYDPGNVLATMTNSWSTLVDPLNPANSPLAFFTIPNNASGFDLPGVDLLMETSIPAIFFSNGASLTNDEFGMRQFLYPILVPEPSTIALAGLGLVVALALRRRGRKFDREQIEQVLKG